MQLGIRSRTLKGLRRVSAFWSARSELDRLAATHTGHVVNYFEIYDRHFSRFRNRDIALLEIGVAGGGSLEIWRRYFGPKARIVGIDINPACTRFEAPGVESLKEMIDEINAWFWREGVEADKSALANSVHGLHFYPALVVIEKRAMRMPTVTPVGHTHDMTSKITDPPNTKRLPWSN